MSINIFKHLLSLAVLFSLSTASFADNDPKHNVQQEILKQLVKMNELLTELTKTSNLAIVVPSGTTDDQINGMCKVAGHEHGGSVPLPDSKILAVCGNKE